MDGATTLPNACIVLTGRILSVSDEAKRRVGGREGKFGCEETSIGGRRLAMLAGRWI